MGHRGNYLVDADAAFRSFVDECLKNEKNCAIANTTGDNSATEVFDWLNESVEPLAANATTSKTAWRTYAGVKSHVSRNLYFPVSWPSMAEGLVAAAEGNFSLLTPARSEVKDPYDRGSPDSPDGIRCSDYIFLVSSAESYLPQVEYQATISKDFSDIGYEALWTCAAWKLPNNFHSRRT